MPDVGVVPEEEALELLLSRIFRENRLQRAECNSKAAFRGSYSSYLGIALYKYTYIVSLGLISEQQPNKQHNANRQYQ